MGRLSLETFEEFLTTVVKQSEINDMALSRLKEHIDFDGVELMIAQYNQRMVHLPDQNVMDFHELRYLGRYAWIERFSPTKAGYQNWRALSVVNSTQLRSYQEIKYFYQRKLRYAKPTCEDLLAGFGEIDRLREVSGALLQSLKGREIRRGVSKQYRRVLHGYLISILATLKFKKCLIIEAIKDRLALIDRMQDSSHTDFMHALFLEMRNKKLKLNAELEAKKGAPVLDSALYRIHPQTVLQMVSLVQKNRAKYKPPEFVKKVIEGENSWLSFRLACLPEQHIRMIPSQMRRIPKRVRQPVWLFRYANDRLHVIDNHQSCFELIRVLPGLITKTPVALKDLTTCIAYKALIDARVQLSWLKNDCLSYLTRHRHLFAVVTRHEMKRLATIADEMLTRVLDEKFTLLYEAKRLLLKTKPSTEELAQLKRLLDDIQEHAKCEKTELSASRQQLINEVEEKLLAFDFKQTVKTVSAMVARLTAERAQQANKGEQSLMSELSALEKEEIPLIEEQWKRSFLLIAKRRSTDQMSQPFYNACLRFESAMLDKALPLFEAMGAVLENTQKVSDLFVFVQKPERLEMALRYLAQGGETKEQERLFMQVLHALTRMVSTLSLKKWHYVRQWFQAHAVSLQHLLRVLALRLEHEHLKLQCSSLLTQALRGDWYLFHANCCLYAQGGKPINQVLAVEGRLAHLERSLMSQAGLSKEQGLTLGYEYEHDQDFRQHLYRGLVNKQVNLMDINLWVREQLGSDEWARPVLTEDAFALCVQSILIKGAREVLFEQLRESDFLPQTLEHYVHRLAKKTLPALLNSTYQQQSRRGIGFYAVKRPMPLQKQQEPLLGGDLCDSIQP